MLRTPALLVLGTLAFVTCGEPPPTRPCSLPYLGDKTATPQLEVWTLNERGEAVPADVAHPALLQQPPQGGRVVFVGVRATHLDSCSAELLVSVRDPQSNQVRLDGRTINLVPDGTGWGGSVLNSVDTQANVPLCPNQWSVTDIPNNPYQLSVKVTDIDGRKAELTAPVTFRCLAGDATCLCQCRAGYKLGDTCAPVDGGTNGDGGTSTDGGTLDGGQ